jgi:hypothetical protein
MASPLSGLPQDIADIAQQLGPMASGLELAAVASKKFKDSTARYLDIVDALKTMKAQAATSLSAAAALATTIAKQEAKLRDAYSAMMKAAAATKSLSAAHKTLEEAVKKNESAYEKFSSTIKKTQSELNKWIPMLGGQTVTLKGATDALKTYNQSMFDLQRTYQVSGRGSQDFAKALDTVSRTTTLSANKFLDFAKAMNAGWAGIAPGIQSVAALAAAFQDKLGPSQEAVQQGLRATMELMTKFPALGKTTAAAIKALHAGDQGAEKRAAQLKQQLGLQFQIGNISRESYQTQLKLLTNVTSKQKEQVEVNKNLAKVSQSFENTIINLGRAVEPALKGITTVLEVIMGQIERMPLLIMGAATAFKMFDAKMLAGAMMGAKSLTAAATAAKAGASVAGGSAIVGAGALVPPVAVAAAAQAQMTKNASTVAAASKYTIAPGKIGMMAGVTSASSEYMRRSQMGDKNAGKAALVTGGVAAMGGWGGAKFGAIGGAKLGAMIGTAGGPAGMAIGGAIGAGIGGIAGGVGGHLAGKGLSGKLYPEVRKSREEAESLADKVEDTVDFATKFAFALDESRKNQSHIKELAEQTLLIYDKETKMRIAAGAVTYDNVDELFEGQINAITAAKTAAESYFSMLTSKNGMLGQLDSVGIQLSDGLTKALEEVSHESPEIFVKSDSFHKLVEEMQSQSIKINAEISTDTIRQENPNTSAEERLALEEKIDAALVRQSTILKTINEIGQQRSSLLESQQKYVDAYHQKSMAVYESEVNTNKAYEDRVVAQKAVVEAGLMGMGPSLEMTQKLVDQQYNMLDIEKNRQDKQQSITAEVLAQLGVQKDMIPLMVQEMNSADNAVEAREIANRLGKSTVGATGALLSHYIKMEQSQTNQLRSQAKIYELTKNVREGYLDALRDMSVGFGEFETIIGKKDMGVSQIMESAKRVGQGGDLNTYALGGMQDKRLTAMGVGRTPMAMFSARAGDATLTTQSKEMHELSQQRYAGFDVYARRHAEMIQGGQGETVGGALALTNDGYIDALQEENMTTQEMEGAVERGVRKAFSGPNMNPMWRRDGGGMPGRHLEKRDPGLAPAAGAALLRNSRGAAPADTRAYLRGQGAGSVRPPVGDADYNRQLEMDAEEKALRQNRRSGSNRTIPNGYVQSYPVLRNVRGKNPGLPTSQSPTDPNLPDYFSNSGPSGKPSGQRSRAERFGAVPLKDVNVKFPSETPAAEAAPSAAAAASESAAKKEDKSPSAEVGIKAGAELAAMKKKEKENKKLEALRKKHEDSSKQAEMDEYDDANDRERLFVPEIEGNVITAGDGSQYIEGNILRGPESMRQFEARRNKAVKQREALEIKRSERAARKVAHKNLTEELQEQEKKAAAASGQAEGLLGESSTGKNVLKRRQEEEAAVKEAEKADEAYATAELDYSAVRADGANPTYLEEQEAKDKVDAAKKAKEEADRKAAQAKAKHKSAVKTHETHLRMVQEENKPAPLSIEQIAKEDEKAHAEAVKADEEAKAAVVAQEQAIVDIEAKKTASRSSMKEKLMNEGKSGGKGIDDSMANALMDGFAGASGDQEKIDELIAQYFNQEIKLDSGTREMLTGFSKEQGGLQTGLSSAKETLAKLEGKAKETGAAVTQTAATSTSSKGRAAAKAKGDSVAKEAERLAKEQESDNKRIEREKSIENEERLRVEAYWANIALSQNTDETQHDRLTTEAALATESYQSAKDSNQVEAEAEKKAQAQAQADDKKFKESPEGKFITAFERAYEHNYKRIESERAKPGNKTVGSIAEEARRLAMKQTLAERTGINSEGEIITTSDYSKEDAETYLANERARRKKKLQEDYYKSYNAEMGRQANAYGGKDALAGEQMKDAQDTARRLARAEVKEKHGIDMTEADEIAAYQAMKPQPTETEAAQAQEAEKQSAQGIAQANKADKLKPKKAGFDDGSGRLEGRGGSGRLEDRGGPSKLGGPRKAHSGGGSRLEDREYKPFKRADPFGYRTEEEKAARADRTEEEKAARAESDSPKIKMDLTKVQKAQSANELAKNAQSAQNAMYGFGNQDQNKLDVNLKVELIGETATTLRIVQQTVNGVVNAKAT